MRCDMGEGKGAMPAAAVLMQLKLVLVSLLAAHKLACTLENARFSLLANYRRVVVVKFDSMD